MFNDDQCWPGVSRRRKIFCHDKVSQYKFNECTVVICDTHQRYNFATGDLDTNYEKSRLAGDEWLERNKLALANFNTIPCKITRWDDWLNSNLYKEKKEIVEKEFSNNTDYKDELVLAADIFVSRYKKIDCSKIIDLEMLFKTSVDYLLEECAIMLLWAEAGFAYEIYPSKRNKAMAATYDFLVPDKNILQPVALSLRTKDKFK